MKFEDEGEFDKCPYCKGTFDDAGHEKGVLLVLRDWSDMHDRETLLHCWDCDRIYLLKYKLDKVIELVEKEIEDWTKK
jgi:Zn-finger nucleic acid-binding protein